MMLDHKVKELDKQIADLQESQKQTPVKNTEMGGLRIAFNVMLELSCALLVGGLIGYNLDKFFETKFIFFLIFIVLGLFAGVINLQRYIRKHESKVK